MTTPNPSGKRGEQETQTRKEKLPYEAPLLRAIDLKAEEVLAPGCKLAGGPGGPIGASCTASSCFAAGS